MSASEGYVTNEEWREQHPRAWKWPEPQDPDDRRRVMVLLTTLQLAVPMHIEEMRHLDGEQLADVGRACVVVVGEKGDVLQYGGPGCREAFNALARALAAAALCAWGGITFCDLHWCSSPGCAAVDDDHPQPWPWTPRAVPPRREVEDVPVTGDVL